MRFRLPLIAVPGANPARTPLRTRGSHWRVQAPRWVLRLEFLQNVMLNDAMRLRLPHDASQAPLRELEWLGCQGAAARSVGQGGHVSARNSFHCQEPLPSRRNSHQHLTSQGWAAAERVLLSRGQHGAPSIRACPAAASKLPGAHLATISTPLPPGQDRRATLCAPFWPVGATRPPCFAASSSFVLAPNRARVTNSVALTTVTAPQRKRAMRQDRCCLSLELGSATYLRSRPSEACYL